MKTHLITLVLILFISSGIGKSQTLLQEQQEINDSIFTRIEVLQKTVDAHSGKIENNSNSLDKVIDIIKVNNTDIRNDINNVRSDVRSIQSNTKSSETISPRSSGNADVSNDIYKLKNDVSSLQEVIKSLGVEDWWKRVNVVDLEKKIEDQERTIRSQSDMIDRLSRRIDDLERR